MTNLRIILLFLAMAVAIASWFLTCSAWRYDNVMAGILPLEPREFERLTLVTLGTGGARENPDRRGPSSAVARGSDIALVDAGRALAESLRAARIPVAQPEWVLLTNLLPENTVGLDDVLLTGWQGGREGPLRLIGPRGTRALARSLEAAFAQSVAGAAEAHGLDAGVAKFDVVEIEDGWSTSLGALEVTAGALPGGPLEALAYRFNVGERSIVVSGTGWADDALADFAGGAAVLVHEAVYVPTPELASSLELDVTPERLRRDAALHTGIDEVGRLAKRASVSTLVLVRLYPPPVYDVQLTSVIGRDFEGRIVIAEDGDEITP